MSKSKGSRLSHQSLDGEDDGEDSRELLMLADDDLLHISDFNVDRLIQLHRKKDYETVRQALLNMDKPTRDRVRKLLKSKSTGVDRSDRKEKRRQEEEEAAAAAAASTTTTRHANGPTKSRSARQPRRHSAEEYNHHNHRRPPPLPVDDFVPSGSLPSLPSPPSPPPSPPPPSSSSSSSKTSKTPRQGVKIDKIVRLVKTPRAKESEKRKEKESLHTQSTNAKTGVTSTTTTSSSSRLSFPPLPLELTHLTDEIKRLRVKKIVLSGYSGKWQQLWQQQQTTEVKAKLDEVVEEMSTINGDIAQLEVQRRHVLKLLCEEDVDVVVFYPLISLARHLRLPPLLRGVDVNNNASPQYNRNLPVLIARTYEWLQSLTPSYVGTRQSQLCARLLEENLHLLQRIRLYRVPSPHQLTELDTRRAEGSNEVINQNELVLIYPCFPPLPTIPLPVSSLLMRLSLASIEHLQRCTLCDNNLDNGEVVSIHSSELLSKHFRLKHSLNLLPSREELRMSTTPDARLERIRSFLLEDEDDNEDSSSSSSSSSSWSSPIIDNHKSNSSTSLSSTEIDEVPTINAIPPTAQAAAAVAVASAVAAVAAAAAAVQVPPPLPNNNNNNNNSLTIPNTENRKRAHSFSRTSSFRFFSKETRDSIEIVQHSTPTMDSVANNAPKDLPPLIASLPYIFQPQERTQLAQRQKILYEIVESECKYVTYLRALHDEYASNASSLSCLSEEDRRVLFSNTLQPLLNMHLSLRNQLGALLHNYHEERSSVGDVFLRFADFFKLCIEYSNNYSQSFELLNRLTREKNKKFIRWNAEREASHRLGIDLADLLIMPVQRVPRYSMLLSSMLDATTATKHVDYEPLKRAIEKINDVAAAINVGRLHSEQRKRVLDLQSEHGHDKDRWAAPHRHVVCEAKVSQIVNNSTAAEKEVDLIVFSDLVVVLSRVSATSSSTVMLEVELSRVTCSARVSNQTRLFGLCFSLSIANPNAHDELLVPREFIFAAQSSVERNRLIDDVALAKQTLLRNQMSRSKTIGSIHRLSK